MVEVFIGSEATAAGWVTRPEVSRRYRAVHRGVYAPKDAHLSLRDRAVAAWLASRRRGVVAGVVASALHGASWVDPAHPVELAGVTMRPQDGIVPRTARLADDEVTTASGLPVTTRVRTAFDMGRYYDRATALARLDALMWHQQFPIDEVHHLADRYPRAPGNRQLRELLPLVDGGAAAPRESRLRLLLIDAGFPRPATQVPVLESAYPVAFVAMGWSEFGVGVEYGGDPGRSRMLEAMGWIVVRVAPEDTPQDVIARVEAALASRGCFVEVDELQRFTRTFAA